MRSTSSNRLTSNKDQRQAHLLRQRTLGSISKRQLATLFGCLFIIGSAEVVAGPMMVLMGRHFGVHSSAIAYMPAAYGLTYGAVALIAGPLSDRFGRKRPLQAGLLGFAVFSALIPGAPNLAVAVVLSSMSGLCAAIIQPNVMSLVADESPSNQVGQRIGHVFIGLMLAFMLTPVLAGRVADTTGWQGAYFALAGLGILAWLCVSMLFPQRPVLTRQAARFLAAHQGALATKEVRLRLLASYLWLGWVAGFGAVVAEVARGKLAMSPTDAGLLAGFFGLVVITGNLASSRLRRWTGEAALPLTALASALGILAFLLPVSSPVQLALAGAPWAFGYGAAGPLHHARLSSLSERYRGTINSYHASLLNFGIFSVSFLMGTLVPATSLSAFCGLVGVLTFAGAALLIAWPKGKTAVT